MHPFITIPLSRVFILVALSFVLAPVVISADAQVTEPTKHEGFLPPAPQDQEWRLVWHDEFEGDQLDESKWNRLGAWKRRDGCWVQEDAYLSGKGTLLLRTRKEGDRFTSGAINTAGKFEHAATGEAQNPALDEARDCGSNCRRGRKRRRFSCVWGRWMKREIRVTRSSRSRPDLHVRRWIQFPAVGETFQQVRIA
jgi:hypothetical protein